MAVRVTTTAANENVLSPDGETLYVIGVDGKVRSYQVDTNTLLATWAVGVNLGGADITADGRYLVVAEREPVSSSLDQYGNRSYVVATYRLDLLTGDVRRYDFNPTWLDHTFFDVAVLSNGSVLLSQSFRGSGWINLKTLNLETGVYSVLPISVRQDSILSLTEDRAKVLVAEANISNAEIDLYQVSTAGGLTQLGTNGSSGFNRGVQDISSDGRYTANHVYGAGLLIFDAQLKYVRNLANEFPSWQSGKLEGLAFDDTGANLYVFDGAAKTIVQISTATWTQVRSLPLNPDFSSTFAPSGRFGNNLALTEDEDFLIVQTSAGVQRVSVGFEGTPASDSLIGTVADDLFRLEQGGDDTASGGAGNDAFYLGAALSAGDILDGGEGALDQLGLQGSYGAFGNAAAPFTFSASHLINIEQLVLLPGNDARFGDTAGATYSYNLKTVDANVEAGERLVVTSNTLGAGENVTFDGSAETDGFFFTYGGKGVDTITGGQGDDGFFFGIDKRFGDQDAVDGQGGVDQLGLQGVYTGDNRIVFSDSQLKSIEFIVALTGGDLRFGAAGAGYSYDLTTSDGNVEAGKTLIVSANTLRADEVLLFDGSAESDGRFRIFSGNGSDNLIGGAGDDEIVGLGGDDTIDGGDGADTIRGGLGADALTGGAGADLFVYGGAAESTGLDFDTLFGFNYLQDKIDLPGAVTGFTGKIETGLLDTATFDADLAAAVDGALEANSAVIFRPNAGDYAGRDFAIVDANGDGVYTAGQDFVFELVSPAIPLEPVSDFFV